MARLWSQRDPSISQDKLGESFETIGKEGCLLCSVINGANLIGANKRNLGPAEVARHNECFTHGLMLENPVAALLGLRYDGADFVRNDANILKALKAPNRFVVLNVDNDKHFVLCWSKPWYSDFLCWDPWYGKVMSVKDWRGITGARYFTKL